MYSDLNKITPQELIRKIKNADFEIEKEYYSKEDYPIPDGLNEIFLEDALRTNQLVFMCR
jgi:hypothetical protein